MSVLVVVLVMRVAIGRPHGVRRRRVDKPTGCRRAGRRRSRRIVAHAGHHGRCWCVQGHGGAEGALVGGLGRRQRRGRRALMHDVLRLGGLAHRQRSALERDGSSGAAGSTSHLGNINRLLGKRNSSSSCCCTVLRGLGHDVSLGRLGRHLLGLACIYSPSSLLYSLSWPAHDVHHPSDGRQCPHRVVVVEQHLRLAFRLDAHTQRQRLALVLAMGAGEAIQVVQQQRVGVGEVLLLCAGDDGLQQVMEPAAGSEAQLPSAVDHHRDILLVMSIVGATVDEPLLVDLIGSPQVTSVIRIADTSRNSRDILLPCLLSTSHVVLIHIYSLRLAAGFRPLVHQWRCCVECGLGTRRGVVRYVGTVVDGVL
mmetsp:Transcript_47/g.181  ORF Transcript_47/g.181 Transcript_47/m.181 type:complete len:367 (-) Transcript_47:112-1212(-)